MVDAALTKVLTSGDANDLRWVVPEPDSARKGLNLNMPLSDETKLRSSGAERQGLRQPGPSRGRRGRKQPLRGDRRGYH